MKKKFEIDLNVSDFFSKRELTILAKYIQGQRIEEIARYYNVTPERILQMMTKIYRKLTADFTEEEKACI